MQRIVEVPRRVWRAWRKFGLWVGDVIARVVLTVFYFSVALPFGVGVRLLSDPLRLKRSVAGSFWHARPLLVETLTEARRQ